MTVISIPSRDEIQESSPRAPSLQQFLLVCGIVSAFLYVAMNVVFPMQWSSYSSMLQTISELSAIGAPTRLLWLLPGTAYTVLATAFGWGVLRSAGGNRRLRIAGVSLLGFGALGVLWPFVPMHQREVLAAGGGTLSDTMHLVVSAVSVLAMTLAIAFAAAALTRRFRLYSIATIAIVFGFGAMTGMNASSISANLPTPWVGLWERISIGAFLLWEIVLALVLLRSPSAKPARY